MTSTYATSSPSEKKDITLKEDEIHAQHDRKNSDPLATSFAIVTSNDSALHETDSNTHDALFNSVEDDFCGNILVQCRVPIMRKPRDNSRDPEECAIGTDRNVEYIDRFFLIRSWKNRTIIYMSGCIF